MNIKASRIAAHNVRPQGAKDSEGRRKSTKSKSFLCRVKAIWFAVMNTRCRERMEDEISFDKGSLGCLCVSTRESDLCSESREDFLLFGLQ